MLTCYNNLNQIVTLKKAHAKDGRNLVPDDLEIIEQAAIVFDETKIIWIGSSDDIPSEYKKINTVDYSGHCLTPEIVDSHTHLVFGGNRAFEYTMRLNGADYQDIASAGGGILATMEKTITATEDELFESAKERVLRISSYGIGTIEVKSGYGLTLESERKITKVIHRLKVHFAGRVQIINTFLAAHAVPGGFENSETYMDKVVLPLLDEFVKEDIIDFVDIFHEQEYFDHKDSIKLFEKAQELGIKIKIHADEFNDNKGAILATKYLATSADHLLCTTEDGISALAKEGTVATLLPGTAFFLGKPLANAKRFLSAGCKVSLASDYNPGSCHCDNLIFIASMAAKSMHFNLAQLWSAITLNAAHALALTNQGAIIEGLAPRFTLFKCNSIDEITYSWGRNLAIDKS
ncbi:MAG: imidazolonepropionase [Halobacteriovoraceae bacterium]|jgi:imidazolonepropionase|nr:imidazolonepropionase [Halobacteriovoraceae bacterium]